MQDNSIITNEETRIEKCWHEAGHLWLEYGDKGKRCERCDLWIPAAQFTAYVAIGSCPQAQMAGLQESNGEHVHVCPSCVRDLGRVAAEARKPLVEALEKIINEPITDMDGFEWVKDVAREALEEIINGL